MSEHETIVENQKSVQGVSKHHGKTDVRYWQSKLFKPWYTRDGQRRELDQYAVKIQYNSLRENFNLGTPNKAAAAAKARDIYVYLTANGWEAALGRFKPKSSIVLKSHATVGDFLEELKAKATLKEKTLEGYAIAFRKILADAFKVEGGKERFDYQKGGHERWLERINAIKLADVTPDRIQEWKREFLACAGNDPVKRRSAKISLNSFLRRAKSLFSPEITKHLEAAKLPTPLPFDGISFEKRQSMRYRSNFDVSKLIQKAREELAEGEPEQFKIFLLATMAGLRRNEIDKLEWPAFRWAQGVIRIEATKWFHPKSEDSLGDIEVDPELMTLFRGYRAKATGSFVIESRVQPRPDATFEHYRCQSHFEKLLEWLRARGVKTKAPLHTLRKEFGSQICERDGIYAASRALRHADITITSQHYLDKKKRSISGLGHLLEDSNVTPLTPVEGAKHAAA
jgi:Phage integrase family